jgi:MinD superfamily P-loop ATPase
MKEIVIISGKGGTGKTSLTASLALLADNAVLVDSDVDAADLHLILAPHNTQSEDFYSGKLAEIDQEKCSKCDKCRQVCRFDAIEKKPDLPGGRYSVNPIACEGCGVCVYFCPSQAIKFEPRLCGEWYISDTRKGKMVHARLGIAAENSGKLVSLVREQAKKLAERNHNDLIIVDGPPGIGCPVIASLTGADAVVVVTEPTISGRHDLERVLKLTRHFGIITFLVINKFDLNKEMTASIEEFAAARDVKTLGYITYDHIVTDAQVNGKAVVEMTENQPATEIRSIWTKLTAFLKIDQ